MKDEENGMAAAEGAVLIGSLGSVCLSLGLALKFGLWVGLVTFGAICLLLVLAWVIEQL